MRFTIALGLFLVGFGMAAPSVNKATDALAKRDCASDCETSCEAVNTDPEAIEECYDACVLLEC